MQGFVICVQWFRLGVRQRFVRKVLAVSTLVHSKGKKDFSEVEENIVMSVNFNVFESTCQVVVSGHDLHLFGVVMIDFALDGDHKHPSVGVVIGGARSRRLNMLRWGEVHVVALYPFERSGNNVSTNRKVSDGFIGDFVSHMKILENVERKSKSQFVSNLSEESSVEMFVIPIGRDAMLVSVSPTHSVCFVVRIHNKVVQNTRFMIEVVLILN